MKKQLEGKVALITGAVSGFGEGIARLFVAEGTRVLIADLDGDKASRVAGELVQAAPEHRTCTLGVEC